MSFHEEHGGLADGLVRDDRSDQLQRLAQASVAIAGAGSPEATLQEIADQARCTIGAHLAATHNVATAEWPYATVAVSLSDKYKRFYSFQAPPTGAGIYTEVVRSKRPIRLGSSQLVRHEAWRGFSEYRREHPPLRGLLAAPLVGRNGVSIGVIMLSDKEEGEFTPDDEAILVQLAHIASISIENALTLEALRKSEVRLRATHENANVAIGECDGEGRFLDVNSGFCHLSGYSRDELLNMSFFDLTHPEDAVAERPTFDRHVAGELKSYSLEKRYLLKDGSTIWVLVSASGVFERSRFIYGVRIVQDITERKRAEERQQLLVRELHHRVNNTLATVQAIAGSTMRSAESMQEFRAAFTDRLLSLGKTHRLLTDAAWGGAALDDLLRLELDPYEDATGNRVKLTGPKVHLPAEMAVALGMAFHELTTNSVKYGSLSVLGGCVEVEWSVQPSDTTALRIKWQERNGPPVTPPTRKGFGSQLLQRALAVQLHGKVDMNFAEVGLCVIIESELPRARLADNGPA